MSRIDLDGSGGGGGADVQVRDRRSRATEAGTTRARMEARHRRREREGREADQESPGFASVMQAAAAPRPDDVRRAPAATSGEADAGAATRLGEGAGPAAPSGRGLSSAAPAQPSTERASPASEPQAAAQLEVADGSPANIADALSGGSASTGALPGAIDVSGMTDEIGDLGAEAIAPAGEPIGPAPASFEAGDAALDAGDDAGDDADAGAGGGSLPDGDGAPAAAAGIAVAAKDAGGGLVAPAGLGAAASSGAPDGSGARSGGHGHAASAAPSAPVADPAAAVEAELYRARFSRSSADIVIGEGDDRLRLVVTTRGQHVHVTATAEAGGLAQRLQQGAAELSAALEKQGLSLAELETSSGGHPGHPDRAGHGQGQKSGQAAGASRRGPAASDDSTHPTSSRGLGRGVKAVI